MYKEFIDFLSKRPHKAEKLLNMYKNGVSFNELMVRQTGRTTRELLDVIHSASVLYNEDPTEKVYYICRTCHESDMVSDRLRRILQAMDCLCIYDRIFTTSNKEYMYKKHVIVSHYIKDGI